MKLKLIVKSTLSENNSAMKYAPMESALTTIANASEDIKVSMECSAVALQRMADRNQLLKRLKHMQLNA